jgi:hypothetical protein
MKSVVKNLAAVKDAPGSEHSMPFITKLLSATENSARLLVVVHRWTGHHHSTTVYDPIAHRLYRVQHGYSILGWLKEIVACRENLLLLGKDEILHLQVVEDKRITSPAFV